MELVLRGMEIQALTEEELLDLPRGEKRKALIALAVKREITVPLDWIASRLAMGTRSTASRVVGALAGRLPKERKWSKLYEQIFKE